MSIPNDPAKIVPGQIVKYETVSIVTLEVVALQIKHLQEDIADLKADMAKMQKRLDTAEKGAVERERKRLTWGISALGTAVLILGSLIWANLNAILGSRP